MRVALKLLLPLTLAGALLVLAPVRPGQAASKGSPGGRLPVKGGAAAGDKGRPARQGLPARPRRAPAGKAGPALKAVTEVAPIDRPGYEAPPPGAQDPDRERILRLQESMASIVHGPVLGRMRVGVRIIDANSGRTFFRQQGAQLMDPASNQKVLATTAAIMRLGADYRFRTEIGGPAPDADGVVAGDVVLRGSGDPSLEIFELEAMAAELASRGVVRIEGGVLADPRRLGSRETVDDERSPLRVSRSAIVVRVRPGAEGAPPSVLVRPALDIVSVRNRAVTRSKGRGRLKVSLLNAGDTRMVLDVSGIIAARHPGMVISRIAVNQRLYAAALLRQALVDAGIEVRQPARVGLPRDPAPGTKAPRETLLALHRSEPLTVLIRKINKDSNNEWAERLLETVGAELYGGPATPDKGLRALREAMDELNVPREAYVPTNGSGLGHTNRLTADALAELLQKLYSDPRWGPELLQSLSVGGVDGTIRNRFRSSPAAERVRAKTGTLNGKSCLSGYVGDGQEVLIFSIMVEGLRGRRFATSAVRAAQVSAVNAMMHYARGHTGAPTGEEVVPGVDYESGEDVIETEGEETPAASGTPGATPGAVPAPVTVPAPGAPPAIPASPTPSGGSAAKLPPPGLKPARAVTAATVAR